MNTGVNDPNELNNMFGGGMDPSSVGFDPSAVVFDPNDATHEPFSIPILDKTMIDQFPLDGSQKNDDKPEDSVPDGVPNVPVDPSANGIIQTKDNTDLIMHFKVSESFTYVGSPSEVIPQTYGGTIPHDFRGNIDGYMSIFNSKSDIVNNNVSNIGFKSDIEKTSKAVGRLFTRYKDDTGKEYWFSGSAFCISPDKVATSAELVKEKKEYNKTIINLDMIFMYFGNDSTVGSEIDMSLVETEQEDEFFQLKPIVDFKTISMYNLSFKVNDQTVSIPVQDSINILEFVGEDRPPKFTYLVPALPSADLARDENLNFYFLIGYPLYTDAATFKKWYIDHRMEFNSVYEQGLDNLYRLISNYTRGFQRKLISLSPLANISDTKLSMHQIPSLAGCIGGVIGHVRKGNQFIGIHLGGFEKLYTNSSISVTHPLFYNIYKRYVLSDNQFLEKHKSELRSYIDYCEQIQ